MDTSIYEDTISCAEESDRRAQRRCPQRIELNDLSTCSNSYHIIDYEQRIKPHDYQDIISNERKAKVRQD